MTNKYLGSCLCGQVKFEIQGCFESFFLCHCKFCQKDTGSAHAANLFSTKAKLHWLFGVDKIKTFNLAPTRHTKSFCSECGSALPVQKKADGLLVVPAGSLDTEIIDIKPNAHIFNSSKACWEVMLENIQRFEQFPS